MNSNKKVKTSRTTLNFSQKLEIKKYKAENNSKRQEDIRCWAQHKFKKTIGKSTISTILRAELSETLNCERKRKTRVKFPLLEEKLILFIKKYEHEGILSDDLIREKALKLRNELNLRNGYTDIKWIPTKI